MFNHAFDRPHHVRPCPVYTQEKRNIPSLLQSFFHDSSVPLPVLISTKSPLSQYSRTISSFSYTYSLNRFSNIALSPASRSFQVAREMPPLCDFFRTVEEQDGYRFCNLFAALGHKEVHTQHRRQLAREHAYRFVELPPLKGFRRSCH